MKKIIASLIVCGFAVAMIACGGNKEEAAAKAKADSIATADSIAAVEAAAAAAAAAAVDTVAVDSAAVVK
jgi:hypothetical protein